MNKRLTDMQRRILTAMAHDETGLAAFIGEKSRKLGFGVIPAKHGGIIVRAYGNPAYFLNAHRLIEQQKRNVPGTWFRLTEAGRSAVRRELRL